ncbi:hypothetical protein Bpfe_026592, partial [Biomphalaria pfeifferi]
MKQTKHRWFKAAVLERSPCPPGVFINSRPYVLHPSAISPPPGMCTCVFPTSG